MPRRLTVGLRYKQQDAWTGGVHYVRGLVRALGLLPAAVRPKITVIGGVREAVDDLRAATGYPDMSRVAAARVRPAPVRFDPFRLRQSKDEEIDVILLGSSEGLQQRAVQWVPDFQEDRLPGLFPAQERAERHARNARWFAEHRHVMLSSRDAAADLARFYPDAHPKVHVVPFATFLEGDPLHADVSMLRKIYPLPPRYFLCANQFWKHKNHELVLRALAAAPAAPPVVFTGREEDYRHPDYPAAVKDLASGLGLGERAIFLGFLPRADQLAIMAGAVAVVQPSLCEGWSTVVEDAKALNRRVIASNIAVHREQLGGDADYFAPDHVAGLTEILDRCARADPAPRHHDYREDQRAFSRRLWRMIGEVERDYRRRRVDRLVVTR